MPIPLIDLKAQYLPLRSKIEQTLKEVLEEGVFIGGRRVERFEDEFAKALGVPHCIGVGNGTDALAISLKALGIGSDDAVVTVANSFIATSEAITLAGARPIFVDCDPSTYLLNFDHLERVLKSPPPHSGRIRALIVVHLYGRALDMTRTMELAKQFNLEVIEDCAQAHLAAWKGRHVGTFGVTGCFSFYPGKNLGAYGDAGAVVTSNPALAEKIRMWRNHGRVQKYEHKFEGVNSRLDTLQAAVLSVKLPHLAEWNQARRQHARLYSELLQNISGLILPDCPSDDSHVYHLFVVRTARRDELKKHLHDRGIETGIHYPIALPNLIAYRYLGRKASDYPTASAYQDQVLSLPLYPELSPEQVKSVATHIRDFFRIPK